VKAAVFVNITAAKFFLKLGIDNDFIM